MTYRSISLSKLPGIDCQSQGLENYRCKQNLILAFNFYEILYQNS